MRSSRMFWGVVITLIGIVLLVQQFTGLSLWAYVWPAFLILLGLWFLFRPAISRRFAGEIQMVNIPLEGSSQADVEVRHGAGRLTIQSTSIPGALLDGSFGGGVNHEVSRVGDSVRLKLDAKDVLMAPTPFMGYEGLEWNFGLSPEIPLQLRLYTGASESRLDLERLKVSYLRIETGASSTTATLPAQAGSTQVEVKSGAASVNLRVPNGVAARIRVESGLSGSHIDTNRFPNMGGFYESPDYATAANKMDISMETGVGSVDVR